MKTKTKNTILAIVVSIIAIFIPALILQKWIEGITFFFAHWFIREQFPKQYHHIVPATCRLITSSVLFFGVSFVLPLGLSLISTIPINYFIGWVGFTKKQADYYETKYNRLKAQLEKKEEFNTDTCTLSELKQRCAELNFSEHNTNLAIEFFIKKTKQRKIADELCVDEKSISQQKWRFKQKLNKK